jgi:hypothetical protein
MCRNNGIVIAGTRLVDEVKLQLEQDWAALFQIGYVDAATGVNRPATVHQAVSVKNLSHFLFGDSFL